MVTNRDYSLSKWGLGLPRQLCCLLLALGLMQPALAQQESGGGFRTLAEIEAALDPLEFLLNHDGVRRSIDLRIRFAFASDALQEAAHTQLQVLGEALGGERLAGYDIVIIGHTDSVGAADYNQRLSALRAEAVRRHLIEVHAIEAGRLQTEGRGASELLDAYPNDAAEQRRVEIVALPREGDVAVPPSETGTQERRKMDIEW